MNGSAPQVTGVRMRKVRVGIPSVLIFLALVAVLAAGYVWFPQIIGLVTKAAVPETTAQGLRHYYAAISGFVVLGFVLPFFWGHGARKQRAAMWKADELRKWGFHSRDRGAAMINYIYYPVAYCADFAKGKHFYSEWLIIHDGWIIVNPGESIVDLDAPSVSYNFGARKTYAWDGCTPKCLFWWCALIGIPDWAYGNRNITEIDTNGRTKDSVVPWQLAHHASLFHDALCQYIDHIPLTRGEVNRLFREMLLRSGMVWPMAWVYYWGVCVFSACQSSGVAKVDTGSWQARLGMELPECVKAEASG